MMDWLEPLILREPDVLRLVRVSSSTLRRMIAHGDFPQPVKLGRNSKGWRRKDVDSWIDSLTPDTPNHTELSSGLDNAQ